MLYIILIPCLDIQDLLEGSFLSLSIFFAGPRDISSCRWWLDRPFPSWNPKLLSIDKLHHVLISFTVLLLVITVCIIIFWLLVMIVNDINGMRHRIPNNSHALQVQALSDTLTMQPFPPCFTSCSFAPFHII